MKEIIKILGDYHTGYLYGNSKNHETNSTLRSMISEIHTPLYNVFKILNKLILPNKI